MKIELSCADCGSNRFEYPLVLTDAAVVKCADCNREVGTVAQIQQRVVQQLTSAKAKQD